MLAPGPQSALRTGSLCDGDTQLKSHLSRPPLTMGQAVLEPRCSRMQWVGVGRWPGVVARGGPPSRARRVKVTHLGMADSGAHPFPVLGPSLSLACADHTSLTGDLHPPPPAAG